MTTYVDAQPYAWPYNGDLRTSNTALIIIDTPRIIRRSPASRAVRVLVAFRPARLSTSQPDSICFRRRDAFQLPSVGFLGSWVRLPFLGWTAAHPHRS